jgi:glycosyltransferase involved in cell wall biosynthesis
LKTQVIELLKKAAPKNSRRRKAIFSMIWFYRTWYRPRLLFRDLIYGRLPGTLPDPLDLETVNRFFQHCDKPLLDPQKEHIGSEVETIRWILLQVLTRPECYALGLSDRLRDQLMHEQPNHAEQIRQIFASKPGKRSEQYHDEHLDIRINLMLGRTPRHRAELFKCMLIAIPAVHNITSEEALWFILDYHTDPFQGFIATYRMNPKWQEAIPNALTAKGWPKFLEYLATEEKFKPEILAKLPAPDCLQPQHAEELDELVAPTGKPRPIGMNVLAHFRYPSGLQEAALNTERALKLLPIPHALRDVPAGFTMDLPDRTGYLDFEPFDVSVIVMAPVPTVDVCYPLSGLWQRPGTHRLAVWYWELEAVPPEWVKHAELLDEIWAPTKFIHDAMQKVMPIPVVHLMPGVVEPVCPDLPRSHFGLPEDKFLFLFLFDMNSVFERKNPLAVVESYRKAFGKSQATQLVIKVSRGQADPKSFKKLKLACEEAGAILIDNVYTRNETYALQKACDCYVSLHRSEGYGLTMAEAMFFGRPVIATAYSGNLDFMTEENSYLIPFKKITLTRDYNVYRKGSVWADADTDAAAKAMKRVFENQDESRAKGLLAQSDLRRMLSIQAYGERILKRLEEIRAGKKQG